MSNRIFISYRRQDAIKDARSLYERLSREFGPDKVFIDLDGIAPGEDFVELLERQLDDCSALVVLIGRDWANERLFDENDFVRIEVGAGLRRRIKVFPVLINGAAPPKSAELPEALRPLLRRQAVSLDDRKFDADVAALAQAIRRAIEPAAAAPGEGPPPAQNSSRSPSMPQQVAHAPSKPPQRQAPPSAGPPSHQRLEPAARPATTAGAAVAPQPGLHGGAWVAIGVAVLAVVVGTILFFSGKPAGSGAYGSVPSTSTDAARPAGSEGAVGQASAPQSEEAPSAFVGHWVNSVPGDGAQITISQRGAALAIAGQSGTLSHYELGKDGRAVQRHLYAQDGQHGHEVSSESEADLVQTTVATLAGDVLTFDTTSDYRRPYFNERVHTETSQRQFRRQ